MAAAVVAICCFECEIFFALKLDVYSDEDGQELRNSLK